MVLLTAELCEVSLGIQLDIQGSWFPWEANWEPRSYFRTFEGYFRPLRAL